MNGSDGLANELGGYGESLADELGGWDEASEEEGVVENSFQDREDHSDLMISDVSRGRDSGIDLLSSPTCPDTRPPKPAVPNLKVPAQKSIGHARSNLDYDGSEYGSESDLEESQLVSASLEARLAAVESLARRGIGNVVGQNNVVTRTKELLKDLGGQTSLETAAARFATAHTAISTHLAHQTRVIQQLTSTILSPLSHPIPLELVDSLLPTIESTVLILNSLRPPGQVLDSLQELAYKTTDLFDTLSALRDTLHVISQTSQIANRRLRAAKEALRDWQSESQGCQAAIRSIEQGCWNQRLQNRECAMECRDVLDGFEETCGKWRERLFLTASATAAPV